MAQPPSPGVRVNAALTIPASELGWRFSRSSGPGGQGVNTADSRVELIWNVADSVVLSVTQRARLQEAMANRLIDGVLTIAASEHRAQLANREAARSRLADLVAAGLAPPPRKRRATRPTRASRERRLTAKNHRTITKRLRRRPTDTW